MTIEILGLVIGGFLLACAIGGAIVERLVDL